MAWMLVSLVPSVSQWPDGLRSSNVINSPNPADVFGTIKVTGRLFPACRARILVQYHMNLSQVVTGKHKFDNGQLRSALLSPFSFVDLVSQTGTLACLTPILERSAAPSGSTF